MQTKEKALLGKLGAYTNVLTKTVPKVRVESLAAKILTARVERENRGKFLLRSSEDEAGGHHSFRHHGYQQLCPNAPLTPLDENHPSRCRRKGKRKKKRKCREDEDESDDCQLIFKKKPNFFGKKKCEEGEEEEECQKRLHMIRKKRKSRNGDGEETKNVDVKSSSVKEKNIKKKKKSEKVKGVKKCDTGCAPKSFSRRKQEVSRSGEMHIRAISDPTTEKPEEDYDAATESHEILHDVDPDAATEILLEWTTSSAVHD